MRYLTFLLLTLFLHACGPESGDSLSVISAQLAVRDTFGLKGKELLVLKKADQVSDLGQVGSFESIIEWNGNVLQSPWIKVRAGKQQGWTLAALLKPKDAGHAEWLQTKRLQCYFGPVVTGIRKAWLDQAPSVQTDAEMATHYRQAMALRDTLMTLLARRAETSESGTRLNYDWMRNLLPGFIAQKVPGQSNPYLFADYNYWLKLAAQTSGAQDDLFFETCTTLFPFDKIESFFPVWTFQLDDNQSASQLGSGNHLKVLADLEKKLPETELFRKETLRIKDAVIEDIVGNKVGYWQPGEKILTELKEIETYSFTSLTDLDRMAISARTTMFEDPAANGVRVNLRSGL